MDDGALGLVRDPCALVVYLHHEALNALRLEVTPVAARPVARCALASRRSAGRHRAAAGAHPAATRSAAPMTPTAPTAPNRAVRLLFIASAAAVVGIASGVDDRA